MSTGDVALLRGDYAKCLFWKLALVKELLTGRHLQVRSAAVKVGDLQDYLKEVLHI